MAKYNETLAKELTDLLYATGRNTSPSRRQVLDFALNCTIGDLRHELLEKEIAKLKCRIEETSKTDPE